jgi:hypothetical protein
MMEDGVMSAMRPLIDEPPDDDPVELAGLESFPASDAPPFWARGVESVGEPEDDEARR